VDKVFLRKYLLLSLLAQKGPLVLKLFLVLEGGSQVKISQVLANIVLDRKLTIESRFNLVFVADKSDWNQISHQAFGEFYQNLNLIADGLF